MAHRSRLLATKRLCFICPTTVEVNPEKPTMATKKTKSVTSAADLNIEAQPGPQTVFLGTPADIAIYGGAAGGGKSYGLLLDPLRFALSKPGFYGVIFRRNTTH